MRDQILLGIENLSVRDKKKSKLIVLPVPEVTCYLCKIVNKLKAVQKQ